MTALSITNPHCAVCDATGSDVVGEQGKVRSNVRAFSANSSRSGAAVAARACTRATRSTSLTTTLAIPFHALPIDWRMRVMYENQVRRLRRAGIGPEHRIFDYGCGKGDFLAT